jgi:hypothetical protein
LDELSEGGAEEARPQGRTAQQASRWVLERAVRELARLELAGLEKRAETILLPPLERRLHIEGKGVLVRAALRRAFMQAVQRGEIPGWITLPKGLSGGDSRSS